MEGIIIRDKGGSKPKVKSRPPDLLKRKRRGKTLWKGDLSPGKGEKEAS